MQQNYNLVVTGVETVLIVIIDLIQIALSWYLMFSFDMIITLILLSYQK